MLQTKSTTTAASMSSSWRFHFYLLFTACFLQIYILLMLFIRDMFSLYCSVILTTYSLFQCTRQVTYNNLLYLSNYFVFSLWKILS